METGSSLSRRTLVLPWIVGLAICIAFGGQESQAQTSADVLVIANDTDVFGTDLSTIAFELQGQLDEPVRDFAYTADGRWLGVSHFIPLITAEPETPFFEIDAQGRFTHLGSVPMLVQEQPYQLIVGGDGEVYLLTFRFPMTSPPGLPPEVHLLQLDADTGAVLARHLLPPESQAIAPSKTGVWVLEADRLGRFDTKDGDVDSVDIEFGNLGFIQQAESDSSGALWISAVPGIVDPPTLLLHRLDPNTGSLKSQFVGSQPVWGPMAMRRGCIESSTVRCFHGGRFKAEVRWTDFDNVSGFGQVAKAETTDSALFWFFDITNWELLVKLIDGCENNGHFWVFAAGTTNVEYTLQVTDLVTDEIFTFTNTLGQASPAVTNNEAFSGCP